MKIAITGPGAPRPVGPYSSAVRVGDLLFLSGQIPLDPATGRLVEGDVAAQTRRALENVAAVLSAAGLSRQAIVRTSVYLADMDDFPAVNEAYAAFFEEPYPARTAIQAARLPRDARIEIDAIATFAG